MNVHSAAMQQALDQLKAMREEIASSIPRNAPSATPLGIESASDSKGPSFFDHVRAAVDSVNQQQQIAKDLQSAYARGEDVALTDVAIAMQKSSVAFEATVQVRNKILESYKEILNMSV